ncbi:MAG: hypothetical protein HY815_13415 [Candidatus Riflebacteria bacterium]|nr:hypothetical protein [Candidatus Riflebacteria bacterium]
MKLSLDVPGRERRQLGEILVALSIISTNELKEALIEQRRTGSKKRLGTLLMEWGLITQQQFMLALTAQLAVVKRYGEPSFAF